MNCPRELRCQADKSLCCGAAGHCWMRFCRWHPAERTGRKYVMKRGGLLDGDGLLTDEGPSTCHSGSNVRYLNRWSMACLKRSTTRSGRIPDACLYTSLATSLNELERISSTQCTYLLPVLMFSALKDPRFRWANHSSTGAEA